MAQLPLITNSADLPTLAPRWKSQLDPVLANKLVQGQTLANIALVASTPLAIYHSLGQIMTGWIITDNDANSVIWRTQPLNAKTLTLESSANTVISLWVF